VTLPATNVFTATRAVSTVTIGDASMETSQISPRAKQCAARFERLHCALAASKDKDHLQPIIRESSERFAVWASNLGACHEPSNHISADYRLREALSVSRLIAQNLDELLDVLENVTDIVNGGRPDASLLEETRPLEYPEDEEGIPATEENELSELCGMTADIITSLLKVSMLIRQSTNRDRYAKAAASGDPPFLRNIDIQRIGERFPKIKDQGRVVGGNGTDKHAWLRERLGSANVQRRQYLRYIRDHHNRLANAPTIPQAPKLLSAANQPAMTSAPRPPSHVPSSRPTLAPTESSTVNISKLPQGISEQILDQLDDVDDALSFVSAQDLVDNEDAEIKHRVLRLEEISNGHFQFECPYCRGIIQPGTHPKWKYVT